VQDDNIAIVPLGMYAAKAAEMKENVCQMTCVQAIKSAGLAVAETPCYQVVGVGVMVEFVWNRVDCVQVESNRVS
jgi:hypothetical protein